MKTLKRLAEQFGKLPGVGPKTALRLAHHVLLTMPDQDVEEFSTVLRECKSNLRLCQACFSIADEETCPICRNPSRDTHTILVVADVRDLLAVEETGVYKGVYHVLGGLLSPLQRIGPDQLRVPELLQRVRSGPVEEVILGTVPTAEGEVTAHYLSDRLRDTGVKITRIGSGIPVGGALEYMDALTVSKAVLYRQEMAAGSAGGAGGKS